MARKTTKTQTTKTKTTKTKPKKTQAVPPAEAPVVEAPRVEETPVEVSPAPPQKSRRVRLPRPGDIVVETPPPEEPGESRQPCQVVPYRPVSNTWVDDGAMAREQALTDQKLLHGKRPVARRPGEEKVQVVCSRCQQHFQEYPSMLVAGMLYSCQSCLKRGR